MLALIGDPHLGRGFRTGVPLHRRGEREATIFAEFVRQLNDGTGPVCCVGDLFDSPSVSREIILKTIDAVRIASIGRRIIIMAGNHDRSRQPGVVSSFDLFEAGVEDTDNVDVVTEPMVDDGILYMPWQWGVPILEAIKPLDLRGVHTTIGHHDLESFGGDDSQMYPAAYLAAAGVETLIGGHWHLPGDYIVDGVTVRCTGSMLPYSHAEDPEGKTYVTLTYEELEARTDLYDKVVRVIAPRGAILPELDCLALTVKWVDDAAVDIDLSVASFDLNASLHRTLESHEVPTFVRDFIEERL